jgi:VanZ family protein
MRLSRRQKITISILVPFFIGLVILSHIPIPRLVYQAQVSDKWLHFLAYLNLVFLVWFSVRPDTKVSWGRRLVWLVLLAVCAYGGIDELSQPYFGRTKDMRDFLANAGGVLTGLIMFTFLTFWQALLAVLGITIFGLTNLAKANLSKLVPVSDAVFHVLAYGGFTLVWVRFMRPYILHRTKIVRLVLSLGVPAVFLCVVKAASLLLGRRFSPTDLLFAVLAIIIVVALRLTINYGQGI